MKARKNLGNWVVTYTRTFDTNYRAFFSEDNPQLKFFEALQDIYTKNDNIPLWRALLLPFLVRQFRIDFYVRQQGFQSKTGGMSVD